MTHPRAARGPVAFLAGGLLAAAAMFGVACEALSHSNDFETKASESTTVSCPGQLLCTSDAGAVCVDPTSDSANCGACGAACKPSQVCNGGTCGCPTGQQSCGGSCVDTDTDPSNCGACGTSCSADSVCALGKCVLNCAAHQEVCSAACVDLASDPHNCGECGNRCPSGASCQVAEDAGSITYSCCQGCACAAGLTACEGGVCADVASDPANCGGCGVVCGAGQSCVSGSCVCNTSAGQTYIICDNTCRPCPIGGGQCSDGGVAIANGSAGSSSGSSGSSGTTCQCLPGQKEQTATGSNGGTADVCCADPLTKAKVAGDGYECCLGANCCAAGTSLCVGSVKGALICKVTCPDGVMTTL